VIMYDCCTHVVVRMWMHWFQLLPITHIGLRKFGEISVTVSAYTSIGTSDNATSSPFVVRTLPNG